MQPREKILAATVAGLVAVLAIAMVGTRVAGLFTARRTLHEQLESELATQNRRLREKAQLEARKARLQQQSLPADPSLAGSLYQQWLNGVIEECKLSDVNVRATPTVGQRGVFERTALTVSARATLPELVEFLYRFHRADHLHQIRVLRVEPIERSRLLDLSLTIEALSLPGVTQQTIADRTGDRLRLADRQTYVEAVAYRNLFGPPNRPPTLSPITTQAARPGRALSFSVAAKDPDPLDRLQYSLAADAVPGATIDPASGRFSWTPPADVQLGEHRVTVRVADDGLPPRSAEQTVTIRVAPPEFKLASVSDQTIELGKSLAVGLRLTETDSSRSISYALLDPVPPGASVDPKTGQIRWTPSREDIGRRVSIKAGAREEGSPEGRTDSLTFSVTVVEPKRPEITLDFDARHTFLTAIVESGGEPEAWLVIRPQGLTLKLRADSPFEAGSMRGRVVQITPREVLLLVSEQLIAVPLGKSLADYERVGEAGF